MKLEGLRLLLIMLLIGAFFMVLFSSVSVFKKINAITDGRINMYSEAVEGSAASK